MNKAELVDKVAEKASSSEKSMTKKDVDSVITATIDAIMEAIASGEKVTLVGFGSFERRERKEREGRNPKTGDTMVIPATKVPAFSTRNAHSHIVHATGSRGKLRLGGFDRRLFPRFSPRLFRQH